MSKSLQDWLVELERRHVRSIDLGLDRCGQVFARLGSPRPAPRVFTVGGTNGKGSVTSYLTSLLRGAGLRCGTYTSPHLLQFNERIRIDGQAVSDEALTRAFEVVEAARGDISLTYFEFTTLAAFHIMNSAPLDVAVLEVGLGGRLDTVNLVDADCAVITPVGLDHQAFLGNDRESIGFEKAGIMRPERPVVCGDPDPPQRLLDHARDIGAHPVRVGREFRVSTRPDGLCFESNGRMFKFTEPPLPGAHQRMNLAVALAALEQLYPRLLDDTDLVNRAISATRLSGRLHRHESDQRVILDVGHNPMAAEVVACFLAGRRGNRCFCVLGMLADKDAEGVAMALGTVVDEWLCAGLEGARGQSGAALAARIEAALPGASRSSYPLVNDALRAARQRAAKDDCILVFGSFETVAAAMRMLDGGAPPGT